MFNWRQAFHRWSIYAGLFALLFVLSACQPAQRMRDAQATRTAAQTPTAEITTVAIATAEIATVAAEAHTAHAAAVPVSRGELTEPGPIELDPSRGQQIGPVYEAFLSPHQEGGEEEDTPGLTPQQFLSTQPSVPRNERPSRGHGVVAFTNDLSKAYVYVKIEGVNPEEINMFHIHCGRPGQLGPILVDFALAGSLQEYFADGYLALEITNEDIVAVAEHGEGIVGVFTAGCPIVPAIPMDKVKTVAGMQFIAEQGELYFNLHTRAQTFFGDIRGQLQRLDP